MIKLSWEKLREFGWPIHTMDIHDWASLAKVMMDSEILGVTGSTIS